VARGFVVRILLLDSGLFSEELQGTAKDEMKFWMLDSGHLILEGMTDFMITL